MIKDNEKKTPTDTEVKRKAIKLVTAHLKKKAAADFMGSEHVAEWVSEMEKLLGKTDFNIIEYIEMRKKLNSMIEEILEEEMRFKLRDSWYSLGKAIDKKVKLK